MIFNQRNLEVQRKQGFQDHKLCTLFYDIKGVLSHGWVPFKIPDQVGNDSLVCVGDDWVVIAGLYGNLMC